MSTELFPFTDDPDEPAPRPATPRRPRGAAADAEPDEPQGSEAEGPEPDDEQAFDAAEDDGEAEDDDEAEAAQRAEDLDFDLEAVADDAPGRGDPERGDPERGDAGRGDAGRGERAPAGTWEGDLERLRARFPGTRDGALFCIYKLEQDPELMLRDFKAEAELRGVPLSGRSFHSARVLLGLEAPTRPRPRRMRAVEFEEDEAIEEAIAEPVAVPRPASRAPRAPAPAAAFGELGADFESVLRDAVERAATQRTEALRSAIRDAIRILSAALDED
jgi:hypothetical protein